MRVRTLLSIGAVLAMAGLVVFSTGQADEPSVKLFGDKAKVAGYLKEDIAELQKILGAAKIEKKDVKRAKVLAMVIGMNAQATGNMGAHEAAGKVLAALKAEDNGAAKTAAGGFASAGSGKAQNLVKHMFDDDSKDWDRDLVMQLFKTPRAGGQGIESKIKKWAEDGVKAGDVAAVNAAGQKSAVIGAAIEQMDPPPAKKGFKSDWIKFAKDMQAAAEEAANAKDAKGAQAALGKIDAACTKCHEKFK